MKTDTVRAFLEHLRERWRDDSEATAAIGRVIPATWTFDFRTPEEFETCAREAALALAPELAGKSFHVRFHRRGLEGGSSAPTRSGSLTKPWGD